MPKYLSNSEKETKQIAAKLAKQTKNHIFALNGQLGAGKTTFAQGFAQGLGVREKIISPTFVLIRQNLIPKTKKTLYHIDLYRLEKTEDINQLGLKDLFADPNNIILIEWAERLKNLPKEAIKISIHRQNNDKREIEIYNL